MSSIIKFRALQSGAMAVALCSFISGCNLDVLLVQNTGSTTIVYESRQPRQCEVGISPQASAMKLIHEGLDVRNTGCAVITDTVYPSACGAPTGSLVMHEIPTVSLAVALRLGFQDASVLQLSSGNAGYTRIECQPSPYQP